MHFFVDHNNLSNQSGSGDSFGPVAGDPTNKYDVSANFQLASDARAFACQAGQIIVVDYFDTGSTTPDPNLVNIILKPGVGLDITFPSVKYYLYRGVRRDSFFTSGSFNAEASDNSDTIRTMWEDWHKLTTPDPLTPKNLGYDPAIAGTDGLDLAFSRPTGDPLSTRQVKEGEWIGTFGSTKKIAFEVIVEAELVKPDFAYARQAKAQIDVTTLAAVTTPTAAQSHQLRCDKEKILAYLDPAALFGMHYSVAGVKGMSLTAQKGSALVTTFLSHFATANRVYIDVRSEKGYSYNFYGNYAPGAPGSPLIRFKAGSAASFTDDNYTSQGWPLFFQDSWTGTTAKVPVSFELRVDDNTKPLLFVENLAVLPKSKKNFIDDKALLNGAATDWTKPFSVQIDADGSGSTKACVAQHVRMQYFKQDPEAAANARLLKFDTYLDTVFGAIDFSPTGKVNTFKQARNEKVGLVEGSDFTHVPTTGIYFDTDVAFLYSESVNAFKIGKDLYPQVDFSATTMDDVVKSPVFPKEVIFNRWTITVGGTPTKIVQLTAYSKGAKSFPVTSVFFLGLKRAELDRLLATTGFGPLHQRYCVFVKTADEFDDTGFPFNRYEVKVQGLSPDGNQIVVAAVPPVFVNSSGSNVLSSSDFASTVVLPDTPPDPGLMKQWDFINATSYAFGDADVTAISSNGRVVVQDAGNEHAIKFPIVRLRASLFFPVDTKGNTTLSTRNTKYPLVIISHGNGQIFHEYDELATYLAHNGFVVASLDNLITVNTFTLVSIGANKFKFQELVRVTQVMMEGIFNNATKQIETLDIGDGAGPVSKTSLVNGTDFLIKEVLGVPTQITLLNGNSPEFHFMGALGRANVIFEHLKVLQHKFPTQLENKVAIFGHSRGAEGVVQASVLFPTKAPTDLDNLLGVASLAPTDQYAKLSVGGSVPYYVLYGSRDGDVAGWVSPRTVGGGSSGSGAFSLYDRANNGSFKSMTFVHRATHNGFITNNHDYVPSGPISPGRQKPITKAYINAFMRRTLLDETAWMPYFKGEFLPASVTSEQIFQQYKDTLPFNSSEIDSFEDLLGKVDETSKSKPVIHSRGGTDLQEGLLSPFGATIDVDSPHETRGLKIKKWQPNDTLEFTIDAAGLDATPWTHLSFRICQVARLVNSPIDTMQLKLADAATVPKDFTVTIPVKVPPYDLRSDIFDSSGDPEDLASLTKSALMTVRIPLDAFYAGGVEKTKVKSVTFIFPATGAGNIEIDDIELTL